MGRRGLGAMSCLFNYNAFTAEKNNLLQNVIQIFSYIQNAESINFNNLLRENRKFSPISA